jgi:putative dimethyl sulfoxide reductase chaperone
MMQHIECEPESAAIDLARECLYRFLATVAAGPYAEGWTRLDESDTRQLVVDAANLIRGEVAAEAFPLGYGERSADELDCAELLAELQKPLAQLRADFDRVFGLVTPRECPPYETEYHPNSETFFRSQQMADIAGFYHAFGIEPAHAHPERPDHLALELEFMAFLQTKQRLAFAASKEDPTAADQAEVCELAAKSFFRDHLAWWVPTFATGLMRKAGAGYNAAFARLLAAFIPVERQNLGVEAPFELVQPDLIERPEEQSGCATCPLHH